jgi:cell division protein FtsW
MVSMELRERRRGGLDVSSIRRHRPDYGLLLLTAALLAIGLIVIYAIGPALSLGNSVGQNYYVNKQLIAVGLSILAFIAAATIPLAAWKRAYKPLLVVAAITTLIALIMPVNVQYPAHRWIRLGSFSFQSVELLKFAILIWLSGFLADTLKQAGQTDFRRMLVPLLLALIVVGVVVAGIQSDLGSTGVIVIMMSAMVFVAGMPFKRVLLIGGIIAIGVVLAVSITPYRRARLATYIHPTKNCVSTGYQACQALIAVGSGGVVGQGLGRGVQAYGYLPEAANDSIFAIYAEKFGFIGTTILLGVFLAFFARLKNIVERVPDNFSRFLAVGVLTWLSVQTLINVGAMIGLLPLKGITLPFISYGGTSIVFVMAAVGLVFQISRYSLHQAVPAGTEGKSYEDRSDGRRIRGAYHPTPSARS